MPKFFSISQVLLKKQIKKHLISHVLQFIKQSCPFEIAFPCNTWDLFGLQSISEIFRILDLESIFWFFL